MAETGRQRPQHPDQAITGEAAARRTATGRLPDPAGSAGPPLLDHDTRGGEPLDCGIVKAVLAQHLACVL